MQLHFSIGHSVNRCKQSRSITAESNGLGASPSSADNQTESSHHTKTRPCHQSRQASEKRQEDVSEESSKSPGAEEILEQATQLITVWCVPGLHFKDHSGYAQGICKAGIKLICYRCWESCGINGKDPEFWPITSLLQKYYAPLNSFGFCAKCKSCLFP